MPESEHDDLADALARMAQEDVVPAEHEPITPPPGPARPAARPAPARPAAPSPTPPRVQATPPKPARPAAPALGTPTPPPAASTPRPAAPASSTTASAAAAVRKPRPTAPTIRQTIVAPTDAEADGGQSTGLSAGAENGDVVDDDDSVIVPAPEASVFMPRVKSTGTAEVRAAIARKKNLNFRRTIIPPMLTMGVLMGVFGFLKPLSGPDSMFANLPGWIPSVLLIGGAILLVLAMVNMLSVKAQLDAEKK